MGTARARRRTASMNVVVRLLEIGFIAQFLAGSDLFFVAEGRRILLAGESVMRNRIQAPIAPPLRFPSVFLKRRDIHQQLCQLGWMRYGISMNRIIEWTIRAADSSRSRILII